LTSFFRYVFGELSVSEEKATHYGCKCYIFEAVYYTLSH
jgi:hypothetical protein